ncbi:MFS general substrate transporter [Abortiporus biennis]|nr:MFS general substrate transporter [Abortiporus biennis]
MVAELISGFGAGSHGLASKGSDCVVSPGDESGTKKILASTLTSSALSTPEAKRYEFWMILFSLCIGMFCTAMELTSVAIAIPTITRAVNGQDFVWINSAFALASTSLIPVTGGLADVFGRRVVIMSSFALFALGSVLCGSAQNMSWLIAARSVQGAGSGGIHSLTQIILSDLVSLRERAKYNGVIGLVWALTIACGPLIGGAFATGNHWRWIFYVNLPLTVISATLVMIFLRLKSPQLTFHQKLARIDWIGNILVIASSASVVLGLAWGGVKFPWSSVQVIGPLILGFIGLIFFAVYEFTLAKTPIMPLTLLSNRTTVSGYIQNFVSYLVGLGVIIFSPALLQGVYSASPIQAGVHVLPASISCGIFVVLGSICVATTKRYRPIIWAGWVILIVGCGAFITYKSTVPDRQPIAWTLLVASGAGILLSTTYFPVLAPLSVSQNARGLAMFSFFRSFAGVWTIVIGSAVLDNEFSKKLSPEVLSLFPGGANGVFFSIPVFKNLPEPARTEVRVALGDGISVLWEVLMGIAGVGVLASLMMKGLPLHTQVDENWGLEEKRDDDMDLEALASQQ